MVFAADVVANGIADGVICGLIVHIQHGLKLNIHLFQLGPGGMILDNYKLISAESGQETVLCKDTGQVGCKGLNEHISLLVTVGIVDLFQVVQVEHHHTHIQGVICILKLQKLLFQ